MRPLWGSRLLLGLTLVGGLAGCLPGGNGEGSAASEATNGPRTVALTSRYAGSQCGGSQSQPLIRVARDAQAFAALRDAAQAGGELGEPPDFSETVVVRIDMGQRRSGGYAITLRDNEALVRNGALIVPVNWRLPDEGAMTTSVITHPCLILTAPGGGYDEIRAVDQDGNVRVSGAGEGAGAANR